MERHEVIIIGGSYAGMAAAMGLGRALRKVCVVDSNVPANRVTPYSHNFLTQDGRSPSEISQLAREQLERYSSVKFINGLASNVVRSGNEFIVTLDTGKTHVASRLVLATGIIDELPTIDGLSDCWGKSVLHCPYCHGYEVRNVRTGIFGNGDYAFEFSALISNWTSDLTAYTNGRSTLTAEQTKTLTAHNIPVIEESIQALHHKDGYVEKIEFVNGGTVNINAIYLRPSFRHSELSIKLGCELSDDGYLKVDAGFRTTVSGIYACGDNVTKMRTVANAVAMGTSTAITLNRDLVLQSFAGG
jgi:thioredoxin reductase